jgi:hypothetical protein
MFRPLEPRSVRRGNTLIVVLSCLSLLTVVGLTAVYLGKDQAERARINGGDPGVDAAFSDNGMSAFNFYLATLIYDAPDSGQGLLNAARGHSLMATMYGRYSNLGGVWQQGGGIIPWNGVGPFAAAGTTGNTPEVVAVNGEAAFARALFTNHRVFSAAWPIYDPEYAQFRATTGIDPASYIPKNAAYTYPDLNNYFLAAQCPPTGEVLVPSYYRPYNPDSFGTLDPANPNWRNWTGTVQILRPTQTLHPQFPTVPPNADNTYTGDVANLPGAYYFNSATGQYVAKNDSLWLDIGLPPFTLPSGKRVKALVAPLVLDLNGRLNLSVHGNLLSGGLPSGKHTSGAGLGAWEVSLERPFGANAAEARSLIANRWPGASQSGRSTKSFAPHVASGNQTPTYSSVPWTGNAGANPASLLLPGQGGNSMFASVPSYTPTFTAPSTPGYDSTNSRVARHPARYNPTEWSNYPLSDTRLLSARYAASPFYYSSLTLGSFAPNTLLGTSTFVPAPAASTPNSYRLDPAHVNRLLYTTSGYDLDRVGLAPNGQTQSPYSALGGIDLNRKLADYRDLTAANNIPVPQPLSPSNMGNQPAADADRQQFAMDIFVRLVAATLQPGSKLAALVAVNTNGTLTIAADPVLNLTEFNTLRSLAQLAANIVDYIDDDDISTQFLWYTVPGMTPVPQYVYGIEKPRIVLNEAYAEIANDPTDPAFTDMTKKTPSQKAAQVRFWLELQNPTSPPYAPGGTGPLGNGVVKVRYVAAIDGVTYSPYQVQIVRNSPGGVVNVSDLLRNPANPSNPANVTGAIVGVTPDLTFDFSAADATNPAAYALGPAQTNPPTGLPNAAGSILVCAANVTGVQGPEFNPGNFGGFPNLVPAAAPGAPGTPGPSLTYTIPLATVFPQNATAPTSDVQKHVILLQRLANPYLPPGPTNPYITVDFMDSVPASDRVLLPNNTTANNPRTAKTTFGGAGGAGSTGYDPNTPPAAGNPDLRPRSLGKVQPYTSYSDPAAAYQTTSGTYNFVFPMSLVLPQNPSVDPGQGVLHTFTRYNGVNAAAPAVTNYTPAAGLVDATIGGDTIMTPFDWFVHLDRPLTNQLEILHVSTGKPHEYTLNSEVWNGTAQAHGADVTKFSTAALYQLVNSTQLVNNTPYAQLYRALDLLRIQPYGQLTALGGRIPGKININTIQDKRVWDALFDVQGGNGFTQAQIDTLWFFMTLYRSANVLKVGPDGVIGSGNPGLVPKTDALGNTYMTPLPGASVYDAGTANVDRPFLPLGAATITIGGTTLPNGYKVNLAGSDINDTLLRGPTPFITSPWIFKAAIANPHPYQQLEAARKILNNTTTVSHNFSVYVTVGYFEVTNETPSGIPGVGNFVQLGREYYQNVPGDTRFKFFAIVDRSMIGLDPVQYNAKTVLHAQVQPFFTTLARFSLNQPSTPATSMTLHVDASSGTATRAQVYSNGSPVDLLGKNGSGTLVIGNGVTQEIVTISAVSYNAANGVATVTITTPLQFNHGPGESVSNILPGNPGPQATFDVTQAPYNYVVPFWSKLQ